MKLFFRLLISSPLVLAAILIISIIATTQIVLLSSFYFAVGKSDIIPESIRTVTVFASDNTDRKELGKLEADLRRIDGVMRVAFLPGKVGLKRLREWLGPENSIVADIREEMLPDAFAVVVSDNAIKEPAKIAEKIANIDNVADVRLNEKLINESAKLISRLTEPLKYAGLIYLACMCLLIFSSIRLRQIRRDYSAYEPDNLAEMNLAIFLEGLFYILIFIITGRYLADTVFAYLIVVFPEIRGMLVVTSAYETLPALAVAAASGLAATLVSLKVRN